MWDSLGVLAIKAAAALAEPGPQVPRERPSLSRSVARLVALVAAAAVVASALVYLLGRLALDAALGVTR